MASLNSRRCVLDSRFAERHYVGNDGVESTTSRTRCAVPGVRAARSAKSANRRLANLSHLPAERIEPISRSVQGEAFVPGAAKATVTRSLPHGDVADEVYAAMDWLRSRQDAIEAALARRHLAPRRTRRGLTLCDLSPSWMTGQC